MVKYRRSIIAGGRLFFTVNLRGRTSCTLTEHADAFRQAVQRVKRERPFTIDAMVVLPRLRPFTHSATRAKPRADDVAVASIDWVTSWL